jgi:hypothetical protein
MKVCETGLSEAEGGKLRVNDEGIEWDRDRMRRKGIIVQSIRVSRQSSELASHLFPPKATIACM